MRLRHEPRPPSVRRALAGQPGCRPALLAAAPWLLAVLAGCSRDAPGDAISLWDITAELGLPPREPYPDGELFLPEITPGGVALLDYDGDRDLDIFQVVHPPPARPFARQLATPAPDRLYRREADGRYREVASAAGVADPGHGQGVAAGDFDGDGHIDLYVTNFGPNHLYRNRGDGTFEDVTARAGLDDEPSRLWGTSAAFLDFDRDNHLDLFVVNYVQYDPETVCLGEQEKPDYCGPTRFRGTPAALYRNRGDGTFVNVTAAAGVGKPGRGLGVLCADFTGDGLVDIYVANDREANFLWVGRSNGTFVDEALARGVALSGAGDTESSMGVAAGDVDGNGLLDVLVTNLSGETHTLYLAQGGGLFADRSATCGLSAVDLPFTGWGCLFLDLDLDSDLDLALVNGRIARGRSAVEGEPHAALGPFWREYAERCLLFANDGQGSFTSVEAGAGDFTASADLLRGLAAGDLDQDGDLDLAATGVDNSLRVFACRAPGRHRWLTVRALTGRRDALGALLHIRLAGEGGAPGRTLLRPVIAAQSYCSSSDPRVHVGLGSAARVEHIEVLWADGKRERFPVPGDAVDREITMRQGDGSAAGNPASTGG